MGHDGWQVGERTVGGRIGRPQHSEETRCRKDAAHKREDSLTPREGSAGRADLFKDQRRGEPVRRAHEACEERARRKIREDRRHEAER